MASDPARVEIDPQAEDGTAVVRLVGDVDAAGRQLLRAALPLARQGRALVVDASLVTGLGLVGVANLLALRNTAAEHGSTLRVRNPSDVARLALDVGGAFLLTDDRRP